MLPSRVMSLADRRGLRMVTLCALYVAQGIPWGFMATTLPAYLRSHGFDAAAALTFTSLPYTFKWAWGPLIDAVPLGRSGRYRPWIIVAQTLMALTVLAIVAVPDLAADIKLLAWLILIHTVFNGLQDVAVDALAVDLLDPAERGSANALMYACKYGGGIVGGYGMVNVVAAYGFRPALIAQTAILGAILMLPVLIKERGGPQPPATPVREVIRSLAQVLSIRSALVTAIVMLTAWIALGVVNANAYTLFLGELGWSYDDYVELTGGWGLAAGAAGALCGGVLARRLGRRFMIAISGVLLGAGWLVFAALEPYWGERWLGTGAGLYEAGALGLFSSSLFALGMDVSWPRIAGSQFTMYMALLNFSQVIGYQLPPLLNRELSFFGVYVAAGAFQIGALALLLLIDPAQPRRELDARSRQPPTWVGIVASVALVTFLLVLTAYVVRTRLG